MQWMFWADYNGPSFGFPLWALEHVYRGEVFVADTSREFGYFVKAGPPRFSIDNTMYFADREVINHTRYEPDDNGRWQRVPDWCARTPEPKDWSYPEVLSHVLLWPLSPVDIAIRARYGETA